VAKRLKFLSKFFRFTDFCGSVMVFGFSHSLTLEAVASHHPMLLSGSRGFIHFDSFGFL